MRVAIIPTDGEIEVREINGLDAMQAIVGGMVQAVDGAGYEFTLWCNENAKWRPEPGLDISPNPRANELMVGAGLMDGDIIVGQVFISGPSDNDNDVPASVLARLGVS